MQHYNFFPPASIFHSLTAAHQQVDPSGPLATLRGLLLSDESLANLKEWIVQHWYAVLFLAVAFMVLLVSHELLPHTSSLSSHYNYFYLHVRPSLVLFYISFIFNDTEHT